MRHLTLLATLFTAATASAHYHMLLPDKHSVKPDEVVTFAYQFGHPFEHELFDTAEPSAVYVYHPDGKNKTDVTKELKKTTVDGTDGKKVTAWTVTYTPPKRGDYTVVAFSPEFKLDGKERKVRDVTKVVLHVQTENGWDIQVPESVDSDLILLPLTRPYGLTPGTAFHVEAELRVRPDQRRLVGRGVVEVEKYSPTAPKSVPADEFVTRTARPSQSGEAVVTLPEVGWWGITVIHEFGTINRCTLWVHVDGAAK